MAERCWVLCPLHPEYFLTRFPFKFSSRCRKPRSLRRQLPEKQCRFNFISEWMHYLSHTDLPDFSQIDVWACTWVTIVLEKTNVVSQNKCDKKVKLKKTALIDASLPLRSGHLHCGRDNIEKVGPTKANEPPPWTIGSLKDKRNMASYLQLEQKEEFRGQTNLRKI